MRYPFCDLPVSAQIMEESRPVDQFPRDLRSILQHHDVTDPRHVQKVLHCMIAVDPLLLRFLQRRELLLIKRVRNYLTHPDVFFSIHVSILY